MGKSLLGDRNGMKTWLWAAAGAVSLAYPAWPPTVAHANAISDRAGENIAYTMRSGDSLYQLASRYFMRQRDWRTVQQINRIGNERAIPVGTVIQIPSRILKAEPLEAKMIGFKGVGQVETLGKSEALALDMAVHQGSVIETGPGSFATMELSNGSRVTLPSQTRLRITAMRRFLLTGSLDFDFMVEKGRIETSAAPLGKDGSRYRIRTPIAVSAVRGTTFRIGYDGDTAPSLTEVVEGTVAVKPDEARAETPIPHGYGASVAAGGSLTKEELLPPPALIDPGKVQVDPIIEFRLTPLPDASAYHLQLARDAGFVELFTEAYSDTPQVSFSDVPNGRWFVRATAIAHSGLEGMPRTYSMKRLLTGLDASAEQDADGGYRFRWSGKGSGKRIYHFRLRPDAPNALPLADEPGLTGDMLTLSDLPPGEYVWQVGVRQYEDGEEGVDWLPEQKLTVAEERTPAPGGGSRSGNR